MGDIVDVDGAAADGDDEIFGIAFEPGAAEASGQLRYLELLHEIKPVSYRQVLFRNNYFAFIKVWPVFFKSEHQITHSIVDSSKDEKTVGFQRAL